MRETGPLYDAKAVIYHVINDTKGKNGDLTLPMLALGAITTAIGIVIMKPHVEKLWADHVKAAKPHAERVRRPEHHDRER